MSEKSVTTTSFINSISYGMEKPPLSSDSSIDSGCNSSTSDSIKSSSLCNGVTSQATTCTKTTHQYHNGKKSNFMLPMQPNVPPPPPPTPPPPLPQVQGEGLQANDALYDNRMSVYQRLPGRPNNFNSLQSTNIYGTYASSCMTQVDDTQSNSSENARANQQPQIQQQTTTQSQTFQHSVINKRSSTSSLESASSLPLMPMNVKGMLLHGLPSEEVMRNWLSSIKCDDQIENFIYHGYDMHLVTRMTPQDLAAIGCKSPALRKKLSTEIKKLNLEYDIPEITKDADLGRWLESLKLKQYLNTLLMEGYNTVEKTCQLTWEDLEEIGIVKLGHQKRLLMAIDKIRKSVKQQEESRNDSAIYDVHPNHRVSLNGASLDGRTGTIGRVRSGLYQTRSGANLDHRGLPVATVMPALKHIGNPIMNSSTHQQLNIQAHNQKVPINPNITDCVANGNNSDGLITEQQIYESAKSGTNMYLNELSATMKRNRPLPPVRTNSLKVSQGDNSLDGQSVYSTSYNTNSTSFLRTPKLGTLTATTNKMLTSGGHIQTLSGEQVTANRSILSPVREAPLPPTHFHQQSSIPEKIEEEPATLTSNDVQNIYSGFMSSNLTSPIMHPPQLTSLDEFPPAPPCQ